LIGREGISKMDIALLEKHVQALERSVFTHPLVIPSPPFPESDHLEPALVQVASDPLLAGSCAARRVPPDYYERDFEYRRGILEADSTAQLCKCVLFEIKDAPSPTGRFVCVVVQYIDKISQPKLLAACSAAAGAKVTGVTMAKEEDAVGLSGSSYNGMTPILMRPDAAHAAFDVKVILSRPIAALDPPFFWLGGGEVDVKFGVMTVAFVRKLKPIIFDISI
jgi:hypothetical protein